MRLQGAILELIPEGGCHIKDLRCQFEREQPQAVDAALVGLRTANAIRIIAGIVTRPGSSPGLRPVVGLVNARAQRHRESVRRWQLEHPSLQQEYVRRFQVRERRRKILERGGYAAQRIREIEGGGAH